MTPMSGYLAGVVLRRAMKGKSAAQVEHAFWAVVIAIIGLTIGALITEALFPPAPLPGVAPQVQLVQS